MQKKNFPLKKSVAWIAIILMTWLNVNLRAAESASNDPVPAPAKIGDRAAKAVDDLLKTLNFEHVYDRAIVQQLEDLFTQNPALNRYAEEIRNFYAQYCRYELLKPRIMEIYANAFNDSELADLITFFRTSTGRKWIENYPALLRQIHELGEQQAQKYRAELQKIIGGITSKAPANPADANLENAPIAPTTEDDTSPYREAPDDQW